MESRNWNESWNCFGPPPQRFTFIPYDFHDWYSFAYIWLCLCKNIQDVSEGSQRSVQRALGPWCSTCNSEMWRNTTSNSLKLSLDFPPQFQACGWVTGFRIKFQEGISWCENCFWSWCLVWLNVSILFCWSFLNSEKMVTRSCKPRGI